MTDLIATQDSDFLWMLGEGDGPPGLRLPPGGVDTPQSLQIVRAIHAAARAAGRVGAWMMISDDEVVGLCGAARAQGRGSEMEIGYGVAAGRRRLGHATRAIGAMIALARAEPELTCLTAVTATDNLPSQAVLGRHGFSEVAREHRDEDGDVVIWRLALR